MGDVLTAQGWKDGLANIQKMSDEKRENYGLLKGHMYFGLHELFTTPCKYLTFLRDPVSRCISHYQMLCRERIIEAGHEIDLSKPDWNLKPAFHRTLDNYQTRLLAGADPDLPFGHCNEDHLKMAVANLERHFVFVGLTEQFDFSLMLMRRTCDWRWRFYIPINVGPKESVQVKPDVVSALQDLNQFDRAIYNYAQERMRKTAGYFGWSLRIEHQLFIRGNELHRRYTGWRRGLKKKLGLKCPARTGEAIQTLA